MSAGAPPLVGVCIPAYNSAKTIAATLDSILGQTYTNLRVLVSDNASTDATAAIAESYARRDPRVKVFRHGKTGSGEANFNCCIKLGEGDYLAIYHADDIYTPGMVAEEVAALESNKSAGAVFAMAEGIDEAGRAVRLYALPPGVKPGADGLYRFEEIFRAVLKYGNFFFCPGVMARAGVYKDVIKAWDEEHYRTSSDLDVWLRMLKAGPVAIIDKPLLRYRLTQSSFSYKVARSRTAPPDIFLVLDEYVGNSPRGFLSRADLLNYRLQKLRDNINRALNLLLQGNRPAGLRLLGGLFSPAVVLHSLASLDHLKVLVYGYAVLLLNFCPLNGALRAKIFKMRFGG